MIKFLLLVALLASFSFAKEKVIAVGYFTNENNANRLIRLLSSYDLYVRKRDTGLRIFVANIDDEDKTFNDIKKIVPDAYKTIIDKNKITIIKKKELKAQTKLQDTKIDEYKEALSLYREKKYLLAYSMFSKLSKSMIDPKRVDFYLGRCAYELGMYDEALAAYERVTINDPKNLRVRLEIAQTYIKMGLYKEAKQEFLVVLQDDSVPQKVKDNIQKNVDMIDNKIKKHFINVTGIFGMAYDSNIDNGTDPGDYSIYVPSFGSTTQITATEPVGAVNYEAGVVFSHMYKKSDDFIVENSLMFYMLSYPRFRAKDLHVVSLSVAPARIDGNKKYSLGFLTDRIWYGHKVLMNDYAITPKYMQIINKELLYTSSLKYAHRRYSKESDKDKNAKIYELTNTLDIKTQEYGSLKANLILAKESSIRGTRTDVDKMYYSLGLSDSYNLNKELVLNTNLNTYFTHYKDEDVNFLKRRADKKFTFSVGLSNTYSEQLILNLNLQLIKQNSNHEPFDYKKYILKSSLYYLF
ncbi:surface lipoprotein assembly modifier [Sulfurimonas sp.]